ncbi:DEAD/DEAH box helicase [bacterium]|nr:DEAD/DEAH box helicase [bacterium]
MTSSTRDEHVENTLASLKDFQRATVNVVYKNLYEGGQKRMLVADEVGLGKTIVAKGIIARKIQDKIAKGDTTPLRVTYICSNQVIAHENVTKLDIYPNAGSYNRFASRITYLAYRQDFESSGLLSLNTLTPATSFKKGNKTGQQYERWIIYALLMADESLSEYRKGLACMLRANVTRTPKKWADLIEGERQGWIEDWLREDCAAKFLKYIRKKKIPHSDCELFNTLGLKKSVTIYKAVKEFLPGLDFRNLNQFREESDHLVALLKEALAEICVDYIDADLYILDEFQRFKDLVQTDLESEASSIAKRIFDKENSRILLLSATPFKAFTADTALESDEEHYKEFKTVLKFLMNGDSGSLAAYEEHRQALFKQLLELSVDQDIDSTHRDKVQGFLRSFICRTERLSVSEDLNAMTVDKWKEQPLAVTKGDVENFIATDNIVQMLNDLEDGKTSLHPPVEFCKSAPYPLSFLDGYKLKKELRSWKDDSDLRKSLRANPEAWINYHKVKDYSLELTGNEINTASSKLKQVMDEVFGDQGEKLLWIPPSLPCYRLGGVFEDSVGFSKTLVFSAWLMVPRMLSTLISYELERRTVGNKQTVDLKHEKKQRKYFHKKEESRHPLPQLVFSQTSNMSNFTILYPSRTLADIFDPDESVGQDFSLSELRTKVANKIRVMIDDANLRQFSHSDGERDRWYWAAPLLLDRHNSTYSSEVKAWLSEDSQLEESTFFKSKKGKDSSKLQHLVELRNCFENPFDAGLGALPENIEFALADMAIGSPSVVSLRSFRKEYEADFQTQNTFGLELAGEFLSLFNKPESNAAIRLSTNDNHYWRRALQYCVDGCLQSVLDEFIHVLRSDYDDPLELKRRLVESMNLMTNRLNVDDLDGFLKGRNRTMRCHYAVDLGNQRMETDEGQKRITGVRQNFNSPFRPFVLSTTSIGQEGLDFHLYCRKIVHWNLPHNPIDLEQREGRINRFKGLVIRQQIAEKYGDHLSSDAVKEIGTWSALFNIADEQERQGTDKCQLIPFWHVEADLFQIERIIPFYPFSKDRAKLFSLLKTLAIYRLAFGQPRQAELVEHLIESIPESKIDEVRQKLMIDLSPISYAE